MEKTAYKILKKLYNSESISIDEINQLTKKGDSKPIEPNQPNKYVTYLKMDKMVTIFDEGGTADGAGGSVDATEFVRITLSGRDYIEKQRKELFMFWIPYAITTAIAVAALLG